ncbi:hypothetical protein AALI21_02830 [Corynebacteriaceae bacterium 6-324]
MSIEESSLSDDDFLFYAREILAGYIDELEPDDVERIAGAAYSDFEFNEHEVAAVWRMIYFGRVDLDG